MKFTAGFWNLKENVQGHFPVKIYEMEKKENSLTIHVPLRQVFNRGMTLNCPMAEISFSSPLLNIIKVRIEHHKGAINRGPHFQINTSNPAVQITDTKESLSFRSGELCVKIDKGDQLKLEFSGSGTKLTDSGFRNIGYMEKKGPHGRKQIYLKDELALGVGEFIYGLGERFTPFIKNGQVVDIWNEDGGTASEIAYKNIPFYISNFGYGVLVNHPEKVSFEIASEKISRVGFSVPGESLEYFIIYGPQPKQVLERYTQLTGRPALPPAWTFGLWLSTSFTTEYDEKTVTSFLKEMQERQLPLRVFHFDCFWMKGFHWCDFKWDADVFPDPKEMLKRLKAQGVKICVWINSYIAQRSVLFQEGVEKGFFVKKPNGDVFQWDLWQAGMALVDFTNSAATRWFTDKLALLIDMGVDCFKTDFGERIPTDVVYYDGSDPVKMHNYYTFLYNKAVFELLEKKLGKRQAVLFARSATTGGQQFPVHWGGDCEATYESMAESLRGGLSLSLSGFGFWSHDIGGFESTAPPDIYKRWIAFGLLSSHSRLHGSSSYRVPWVYDEESVDVLRHFTELKMSLMPYLFQKALEAHSRGIPVMRAMLLEFPGDRSCEPLDRQYMLGDALLVAPVFRKDGKVEYYLPRGKWTHFVSGKEIEGGFWQVEQHGFMSLPLMVRPHSVVPVGACRNLPDYDYAEGVIFHLFCLESGAPLHTDVPGIDGQSAATMEFKRTGQTILITPILATKPWQVILRGIQKVKSVSGATAQTQKQGVLLIPQEIKGEIAIFLEE